MQLGLCHAHLSYVQRQCMEELAHHLPVYLSSVLLFRDLLCFLQKRGRSLCFASRALWGCNRRVQSVRNPSCCALPKLPALERTDILWLSKFHKAEWEDAVLSIPILHIQIFPLVSFLSRRRNFCSRIGNRELSRGREGNNLSRSFCNACLIPTVKFPSALKLWALSWVMKHGVYHIFLHWSFLFLWVLQTLILLFISQLKQTQFFSCQFRAEAQP